MTEVLEARFLGKAVAKKQKPVGVVDKLGRAYDTQNNCVGLVKGGFVFPNRVGRTASWQDSAPVYVVRNGKIYEISGNEHIDY